MADINSLDKSAREYFSSLPGSVQELIVQSDAEFKTRADLETFYRNYNSSHSNR